jgi:hypothetical protein
MADNTVRAPRAIDASWIDFFGNIDDDELK